MRFQFTPEEDRIFIQRYPLYTNKELVELFYPHLTKRKLENLAYVRGGLKKCEDAVFRANEERKASCSKSLKGRKLSDEWKKNLSNARTGKTFTKGWKRTEENKKKISEAKKKSGTWIGDKNPRHAKPLYGDKNGRWNGGTKQLYWDLREFVDSWVRESMEFYDYKCLVTGKNFQEIHHVFPFRKMVDQTFEELGIDYRRNINDYSIDERFTIKEKLLEIHYRYSLGVCLTKKIHKEFHDKYGYKDFTPEDFNQFLFEKGIDFVVC
jgi:hypothetical protein